MTPGRRKTIENHLAKAEGGAITKPPAPAASKPAMSQADFSGYSKPSEAAKKAKHEALLRKLRERE